MFKCIHNHPFGSFIIASVAPIILIGLSFWVLNVENAISFSATIMSYFAYLGLIILTIFVPKYIQEKHDNSKEEKHLYIVLFEKIQKDIQEAERIIIDQMSNDNSIKQQMTINLLMAIKTRMGQKIAEIQKLDIEMGGFENSWQTYQSELTDKIQKDDFQFNETYLSQILKYGPQFDGEIEKMKIKIRYQGELKKKDK